MRTQVSTLIADEQLVLLIYELLDAHADTALMVAGHPRDLAWRAHLDYLRALQRKGRELLAQTTLETSQ